MHGFLLRQLEQFDNSSLLKAVGCLCALVMYTCSDSLLCLHIIDVYAEDVLRSPSEPDTTTGLQAQ